MNLCRNCNNPTENPKFCNKSCAAIYNNKKYPKRALEGVCVVCSTPIPRRNKYCNNGCNPNHIDWDKVTYEAIATRYDYQKNVRIRSLARSHYIKSNRPKECEECSYKLNYHVCHIRPIYTFPGNTPVSTINDLSNLIALCPNCHWEMDNGLLRPLEDLNSRQRD